MIRTPLFFFVCVLFVPTSVSAYDLYVQSVNAPVYAMPDTASGIMATHERGTKLAGIEQKGNWHMIRVGGKTGWIYRFLVNDQPPPETGTSSTLINQYSDYSAKARRRPSSYTAAAAARGLREKRPGFAEKYRLDYETLEKIEAIEITREELTAFIKQGNENE